MRTDEDDERGAEWSSWAVDQLNEAGWTRERHPAMRYIVEQFLGMGVMRTHRNLPMFQQALDIVGLLSRGVALTGDDAAQTAPDEQWVPVLPGQELNRTDRVRVRADAYTEDSGNLRHNGRQGSVLAVRYGRVVVHYDEDPAGVGSYHDLRLLEKRIG